MAEITSYNFLHRIRNLLCKANYLELLKDLVQHNLDNQIAAGPKALDLTLSRLRNTIVVLEPLVEKLKGKPKQKGVHDIRSQENATPSEYQEVEQVYTTDNRVDFYRKVVEHRV